MLTTACQGTRKLTGTEKLYADMQLVIDQKADLSDHRQVKTELIGIPEPKPESKFLGMRPRIAIHNMVREPKKNKGFRHWLKYKVGKAPVLIQDTDPERTARALNSYLYHKGHFNSETTYEIHEKHKTAAITYYVSPRQPYIVEHLQYPEADAPLTRKISELRKASLIKTNRPYDLDLLKAERVRLSDGLRNMGYFNFDPDYLIFRADTATGHQSVRLFLEVKPDTPPMATQTYQLGNITIFDDFHLSDYNPDTMQIGSYRYLSQNHAVKPHQLLRNVLLHQDSLYRRSDHLYTLSRLNGLNYFRYTNLKFTESDHDQGKVDADITLLPNKNLTLSAEVNTVAKSNNFAGPGIKLGLKKRNIFGGFETFGINFSGRFETQIAGENKGNTAFEISTDATLTIPRIVPFRFKNQLSGNVPNSRVQLGSGIFQRTNLYQFNTFSTSFAYLWRSRSNLFHEFKPFESSFTNLAKSSEEFDDFLNQNPSLKKSFEEQFIIGLSYFISLDRLSPEFRRKFFCSLGVETSGILPVNVARLFNEAPPSPENPYKLFNNPISQFVRLRTDNRYHLKTGKKTVIATRLFIGTGYPFGNSNTMPYVKQFFVGGTNSLRGFLARSVGPGTYSPPDSLRGLQVDQTGVIKIVMNMEYRFPVVGVLKGALFLDMGNIWLVNEDTARAGGEFTFERFYKEFAISSGFGLRIDADFLVVRFDWGFPIRQPWLPDGERWVVRDIDFFNRDWRKKNLILNLSIGYPF
jgi:outer membrane protein assembly factor BamA